MIKTITYKSTFRINVKIIVVIHFISVLHPRQQGRYNYVVAFHNFLEQQFNPSSSAEMDVVQSNAIADF